MKKARLTEEEFDDTEYTRDGGLEPLLCILSERLGTLPQPLLCVLMDLLS